MAKHNPENERIKRRYFEYLKEAQRQSEASIDASAQALNRFEIHTDHKSFKAFHQQQAIAFKRKLAEQNSIRSGEKLSKSTVNSILANLKKFFHWLAGQPGYKSRISYSDSDYFNLSEKETRIANARREKPVPTIDQIKHTVEQMGTSNDIELRDRALIAFVLLTGARDSAVASFKLKHIDLHARSVYQDARDVKTKFSKTFTTYFFPVGDPFEEIVADWVEHLRSTLLWGHDDPLFPSTRIRQNELLQFSPEGLERKHWQTTSPIRRIFTEAFKDAGVPCFNPHSFRNTLVRLGEKICSRPEQFKSWSQNLGHEGVMTTFNSYGNVPDHRQGEIIHNISATDATLDPQTADRIRQMIDEMTNG